MSKEVKGFETGFRERAVLGSLTRWSEKQHGKGDALGRHAASQGTPPMRTSIPGDTDENALNLGALEHSPGL